MESGQNNNNKNNCSTEEQEDDHEEEGEMLRRRISSHPLYGLLVETHLNCLKVGVAGMGELLDDRGNKIRCLNKLNQSELDRFMESYCFALGKLKEAMEESQLKSMTFINSMHSQLRELTATGAVPNKPTTSSSETETKTSF